MQKTVRLAVFAAVVTVFVLAGSAEPALAQRLVIDGGVDLGELKEPFPIYLRYEAWTYHDVRATVRPWGWKDGEVPSAKVMRKHDRQLERFTGCGVHGYQVDPTGRDIQNLESNLLTDWYQQKTCPWFWMYENVFAGEYARENGRVDLDRPFNLTVLDSHIGRLVELAMKYQDRYVVVTVEDEFGRDEKRFLVYFWNLNNLDGDIEAAFDFLRQKYPVFIVGGMLALSPPDPTEHPRDFTRKVEAVKAVDGLMHYTAYGRGMSYAQAMLAYQAAMFRWREVIEEYSPGTMLFPTFTPAFDDRLFPGRDNPPMIPGDVTEVRQTLRLLLLLRDAGVVDGPGLMAVGNEPFEGMAVFRNIRHVLPEFEGTSLLRLMCEEYFSLAGSDCRERLPEQAGAE